MTEIIPSEGKLVARPTKEAATRSGIVIPDSVEENTARAKVLRLGKAGFAVFAGTAREIPWECEVGDVILFRKHAALEITIDGEKLLIIPAIDVLGTLVTKP
jgi:co-chaperonin GroES (HSP10)